MMSANLFQRLFYRPDRDLRYQGDHGLTRQELYHKLRWFWRLRWAALLSVLCVTFIASEWLEIIEDPLPLYGISALLALMNIGIWQVNRGFALRPIVLQKNIAILEIIADLMLLTGLLHFAGGIDNPFLIFFVFHTILGGIMLTQRQSYLIAGLAAAFVISNTFLEYENILTHHPLYLMEPGIELGLWNHLQPMLSVLLIFSGTLFLSVYFTRNIMKTIWEKNISIRREHAKLTSTLENMWEGVILLDVDRHALFCNSSARKIFNCAPMDHQVDLTHFCPYVSEDPYLVNAVRRFKKQEKGVRQHESEDETGRSLLLSISPIFSEKEDYLGSVYLIHDQTDLKRLQKELAVREKLAVVGEIAAGVAHEINNPLDGARNCLHIVREKTAHNTQTQSLLDLIDEGLVRIATVVRRLLMFSRQQALSPDRLDLLEIVRNALRLVSSKVEDQEVALMTFFPQESIWINADPHYLSQVFINIIINSLEAIKGVGRIDVKISISRESPGFAEVRISDNGMGIPQENIERIFEPFFTTKSAEKGTGLGLHLSHKIVEEHGGRIRVESPGGKGACFAVLLPLHESKRAS